MASRQLSASRVLSGVIDARSLGPSNVQDAHLATAVDRELQRLVHLQQGQSGPTKGEEDAAPEERLSVQSGKGDGHLDLKTLNSSSRRKVDMSVMDTGLGSMSFWQS
eukprot:g6095.t1